MTNKITKYFNSGTVNHTLVRLVIPAVAIAFQLLINPAVSFQTLRGVRLEYVTGDRQSVVFNDSSLFDRTTASLGNDWRSRREQADRLLERMIGDNNHNLPARVGIYQQQSRLSDNPHFQISHSNGGIDLSVSLEGNSLTAKSTTPTPIGSYGDPKFQISYDAVVQFRIVISPNPFRLEATEVSAKVTRVNLDSGNLPGDIMLGVSSVVHFLGGPDFRVMAEDMITKENMRLIKAEEVNRLLQPVNTGLDGLKSFGPSDHIGYSVERDQLVLTSELKPLPNRWYRLQVKHSSKYLDVTNAVGTINAPLGQSDKSGDAQVWMLVPAGADWYRLQVKHSSLFLDVTWGSNVNGAPVGQAGMSGNAQLWKLVSAGGGWYRLMAKHSGMYLDVSYGSMIANAKVGQSGLSNWRAGAAQLWRFEPDRSPMDGVPVYNPR